MAAVRLIANPGYPCLPSGMRAPCSPGNLGVVGSNGRAAHRGNSGCLRQTFFAWRDPRSGESIRIGRRDYPPSRYAMTAKIAASRLEWVRIPLVRQVLRRGGPARNVRQERRLATLVLERGTSPGNGCETDGGGGAKLRRGLEESRSFGSNPLRDVADMVFYY